MDTPIIVVIVIVLIFCFTPIARIVAHWLNNLCDLPHPGPKDPQGACWCRRHEGKDVYSFVDYIKYVFK